MEEFLRRAYILGIVAALFIFTAVADPSFTGLTTYQNKATSNLTIWDQTDSYYTGPLTKYSMPTQVHSECLKLESAWKLYFYANYTNTTNAPIEPADGICRIRYDRNDDSDYGDANEGWLNMSFNTTSFLWENFTNFTYDGLIDFQINCTSSIYADINLTENMTINNTGPCIFGRQGGLGTNPLPDINCYEDTVCVYDFKENCTDDDLNDISGLVYSYSVGAQYSAYFSMVNGVLEVDRQDNNDTEEISAVMRVEDEETLTSATMNITINPVNDNPVMSTLPSGATEDIEFNSTLNPEYVITATDEEDNVPFKFNATILSCQKAHWIEYPTDNCSIMSFTITADNITIGNFTPTNWDVGTYEINFSVEDSGAEYPQFSTNASTWTIVWFDVTNVNDAPVITEINSSDIVVSQGENIYLIFNGTDPENDTLFFNATAMLWNVSNQSYYVTSNASMFQMSMNTTYYPNVSAYGIIDIQLTNSYVGNYTLNITLTDNGTNTNNMSTYAYVNVSVLNVNDAPEIVDVPAVIPYGVQETPYYYYVNATDPDFDTIYGETLTFDFNLTFCETPNGTECDIDPDSTFTVTKTGEKEALLLIYAVRNDTGNYTINITVTDAAGLVNYTYANVTIVTDEAPFFDSVTQLGSAQYQALYYTFNVSDPENDSIQLGNATLYRNLTLAPVNLFWVTNDSSGYPPYINFTLNYTNVSNEQVGNYTLEVNATDVWNRTTSLKINISIGNVNDPPAIHNFTSCDGLTQYGLNMTLYENVNYCIVLYRPDPDLYVPSDTFIETVNYDFVAPVGCTSDTDYFPSGNCAGFPTLDIDYDTGRIIFTAVDETWHGNYTYNLTINDSSGILVSRIFTMEILPVNDPPVLWNINETINLTTDVVFAYQINATDEENNTPFFYGVSFTPSALFEINNTTGFINFTPQISDIGNYTVNFTVTDAGNATYNYDNATGWAVSNVSVVLQHYDPVLEYFSPSSSYEMTEGQVKDFLFKAYDEQDNDTLTCYFYIDGVLIEPDDSLSQEVENSIYNCNISSGATSALWEYPVSYDDALNLTQRTVNITLVVEDPQGRTDSETVEMTVYGGNRAPRLNQSLQSPVKWYNNMDIEPFDLDEYFIDDYGEELNYSSVNGGHVSISIGDDGNVTISPQSGWYGFSWAIFYAYDTPYNASSIFNTSSNNVTLEVQYQAPIEVDRPVSVYKPKVASLQILVDEIIRVPAQNFSTARVSFYNDGGYNLNRVNLSAVINETNISLSLMDTFLDVLDIGQNFTTVMNITIGDLDEGQTYTGYVHADSQNPVLHERAAFTIKITPSNSTNVIIKIVMIKDLFEENPECMDLFGLILEAERMIDEGNLDRADELIQLAMDNCQDMIDYAELHKDDNGGGLTPSISGQILLNPFFVMGFVIALLSIAMAGYWFMSKRYTLKDNAKKLAVG